MIRIAVFVLCLSFCVNANADFRSTPWNWIFLTGHTAYNINQIYWQTHQASELGDISMPFEGEDNIPEEQKTCGYECQLRSEKIREGSISATYYNWFATGLNSGSLFTNIGSLIALIAKREQAFIKFTTIGTVLSGAGSIFNLAAMGTLGNLAIFYRLSDEQIQTQALVDKALVSGFFYLLTAIPVAAHSAVELIHFGFIKYILAKAAYDRLISDDIEMVAYSSSSV